MGYRGLELNDKVAVVIGGTSGIGRAIVRGLARAGFENFLCVNILAFSRMEASESACSSEAIAVLIVTRVCCSNCYVSGFVSRGLRRGVHAIDFATRDCG
jgi:NAD(P)-dependent dehydrogenase (short-subunit alcohol dehydrogenase family)